MRAVLGIDAAWTNSNPSGVALVVEDDARWRLAAVASSYLAFGTLARVEPASGGRPIGSLPDVADLLKSSERLGGRPVDLVAIDMPLSLAPITGRRASDDAVSQAYGSRGAGTHTPSVMRPGPISDRLTADFRAAGYPLRTVSAEVPGLVEVYPHPALIELASAPRRLCYKAAKTTKYWPGIGAETRRANLHLEWRTIVALLDAEIGGVMAALGEPGSRTGPAGAKAFEDELDAVVCAWVGIRVLEGKAVPFGDAASAIWIPTAAARDASPGVAAS